MANNYTTNAPTTLEFQGDSVGAGTIPLTYDIVITPSSTHVVQAADFFIGNALGATGQLPIEVTAVSFADTSTPLTLSNKVVATVTLAQWYTMGGSPETIEVDIDGKASAYRPTRLSFTGVVNVIGSQDAKFVIAGSDSTTVSETTASSVKTHSIRQDIPTNTKSLVTKFQINANTAGTGFYPSLPKYEIISNDPSRWSSKVTSLLYGSHNVYTKAPTNNAASNSIDGKIVAYEVEFYYDIGDSEVALSEGESIIFTQPTETLWSTLTPVVSIDKIRYSNYKNQGILPSRNTNLLLNVFGSSQATYDILVMDDNGLSYDFALDTFTRALTKSSEQTINLGSPAFATTSNNHIIAVPAYNEKAALAKYLTTTVTPTGSTKTTTDGTSTAPHVITLNQFGEVDFTANVTPATYGVAATTATLLSFLNKKPLSYPTIFNPTDFPLLSTANNSYFNISTPLSYTVNGVVSSVSTVTITLAVTAASLKLQVGDSVTGTNVGAARTIVTIADPDANVIVLSGVDGTVSGTLVFTRNVGISRQPLATDFLCSITGGYYLANTPHSITTEATTNSTTVQISSQGSSIYNGMTVQGNSIVGYPTVVSGGGSNNLVLSSFQTLPSGELLTFSNAMSDYEIVDINITGAGTTGCKLNVEGYVNRVGHANITESLILQNFITSYVAPVATALTATCPRGSSVKISPLATSHTSVLTIAAVAGSGRSAAASATISDDGSYLLYLAPTTGTTETITYTVSDGINTSAAANIVVTLT
tara:strand:- start:365 stop:2650 length:2286 start_codon:yes stop_codon:yes gene_type:complete